MTQQQNKEATLLDSIQSEVSQEASPMLEFLVKHARKIFLILAAFIVLTIIVGIFTWHSGGKQRDAEEALGKILIMPAGPEKLAALEEFAPAAPKGMQPAAYMALAQIAEHQGDLDKVIYAWQQVASTADAPTRLIAGIAQATALSAQGKQREALTQLDSLLGSAPAEAAALINAQIVDVAENLEDWDRAIAACDSILRQMGGIEGRSVWEQRLVYFQSKKQG